MRNAFARSAHAFGEHSSQRSDNGLVNGNSNSFKVRKIDLIAFARPPEEPASQCNRRNVRHKLQIILRSQCIIVARKRSDRTGIGGAIVSSEHVLAAIRFYVGCNRERRQCNNS